MWDTPSSAAPLTTRPSRFGVELRAARSNPFLREAKSTTQPSELGRLWRSASRYCPAPVALSQSSVKSLGARRLGFATRLDPNRLYAIKLNGQELKHGSREATALIRISAPLTQARPSPVEGDDRDSTWAGGARVSQLSLTLRASLPAARFCVSTLSTSLYLINSPTLALITTLHRSPHQSSVP